MNFAKTTLSLTLIGILASGCSQKVAFSEAASTDPSSQTTNPQNPVCEPGQAINSKPTKVIFVVDQSGSNLDGPAEHPGRATDPDKSLRFGALSEFLGLHGIKRHMSWGMIGFKSSGAYPLTFKGVQRMPAFGGLQEMLAALELFKSTKDSGVTPYLAGLKMAQELIASDLLAGVAAGTQYRIAFMSDGYPTDITLGSGIGEGDIDRGVENIVRLAPSSIQVSTVYYGLPDATAAARLQRMAAKGGGEFLDVGKSNTLHLGDVIKVPKPSCN